MKAMEPAGNRVKRHLGRLLLAGALLLPQFTNAGCKSDCADQYESDREDCMLTYDDPDDADALQLCLQNAKDDYENCMDDCES